YHSLISGYAVLFANVIFSLAQVPLALSYLSKPEFALWALASQLGTYLQLVDFGMSSSISRLLIDHKHQPNEGQYGSTIQTGFLVLLLQGIIILVVGVACSFVLPRWLHLPEGLTEKFQWLMAGLSVLLAVTFFIKMPSHLLEAHQRFDVVNYAQIGLFALNYFVQWICLHRGFGVFSILWGNAAGWLVTAVVTGSASILLGLLPNAAGWGKPTRTRFREIYRYGRDVFWVALGSQLIVASQTVIVTRTIGLDAAAIWSVCTRTYFLLTQLVWRIFDYSFPAFAEMIVLGEKERLQTRFRTLVIITTSLSILGGGIFAIANQPFVHVWTHGKMGWAPGNDALLALWFVLSTVVHCFCGFILATKAIGFMRYIYVLEGAVYLISASVAAHFWGMPGVITMSIFCTAVFTLPYGIWRVSRYFQETIPRLLGRWLWPSLRFGVVFGVIVFFSVILTSRLKQVLLIPALIFVACLGTFFGLRLGLDDCGRDELRQRSPKTLRALLRRLAPR